MPQNQARVYSARIIINCIGEAGAVWMLKRFLNQVNPRSILLELCHRKEVNLPREEKIKEKNGLQFAIIHLVENCILQECLLQDAPLSNLRFHPGGSWRGQTPASLRDRKTGAGEEERR